MLYKYHVTFRQDERSEIIEAESFDELDISYRFFNPSNNVVARVPRDVVQSIVEEKARIPLEEEKRPMAQDSRGNPIKVGDKVLHIGVEQTIKRIREGEGTLGGAELDFEGSDVKAGEVNVDLIEGPREPEPNPDEGGDGETSEEAQEDG